MTTCISIFTVGLLLSLTAINTAALASEAQLSSAQSPETPSIYRGSGR